jgi:hypothetical protein
MAFEKTGVIEKILEVQKGAKKDGSGDWEKQQFLLRTQEQYNNLYCFEIFGDQKVDNFAKYNKVGQEVTVEFNVNTSEYNGKYYTTLSAWKITATPLQNNTNTATTTTTPQEAYGKPLPSEEESDLPF